MPNPSRSIMGRVTAGYRRRLDWRWENGAHPSMAPIGADQGKWRLHSRTTDGPGRWGMIITMMANGALYLSLLFGWVYLVVVPPASAVGNSLAPVAGWPLFCISWGVADVCHCAMVSARSPKSAGLTAGGIDHVGEGRDPLFLDLFTWVRAGIRRLEDRLNLNDSTLRMYGSHGAQPPQIKRKLKPHRDQ